MGINTGSIRFGIASQVDAATLADDPTYLFGVESGDIVATPVYDDGSLTAGTATKTGRELRRTEWPFDFTTRAYTGSIGTILKHALGADTPSGPAIRTASSSTHARSRGAFGLQRNTARAATSTRSRAAKITSLRLSWEEKSRGRRGERHQVTRTHRRPNTAGTTRRAHPRTSGLSAALQDGRRRRDARRPLLMGGRLVELRQRRRGEVLLTAVFEAIDHRRPTSTKLSTLRHDHPPAE
jgi:hypothetical protein